MKKRVTEQKTLVFDGVRAAAAGIDELWANHRWRVVTTATHVKGDCGQSCDVLVVLRRVRRVSKL